ncbi:MATE family efflux transporter [Niameybacter massiliensis]|uniref:MATE family efflux transporter n=1 Tax=Niameybacter massiliensis TaxID=1658108 RepID=UPI0006B43AA4|nr:MATE family efflux transporter [Niameybacter massiliensis]
MQNALQNKVSFLSLIKYTFPTVVMMVFFSLYTIIDGMFISRFVGANALSATNIVYPIISILIGIGIMFATGGSAIVAKYMGEGKNDEAKESFSLITLSTLICGGIVAILALFFIKDIIYALGATDLLYSYGHNYLFTMLIFTPFILLKVYFDYFLVTAGAPKLGLISSVTGGIVNIILDYVFVVSFNLGVTGAALATCIGYVLPSIIAIIYFTKKTNTLYFVKPKFNFNVIKDSCINGSSEMVTQLSSAVTTFLYNVTMLKFLGEDGIAAITIILYIQFLLNAAYLGFTSGASPRISFNYGSQNKEQVQKLIKYSYIIIFIFSISSFVIARGLSEALIATFTAKGTSLFDITLNGFIIFSIGFLVSGLNIFTCGMFTAFSNGKVSALLSLLRTFILFTLGIVVLPFLFHINGVWLVVPFAEFSTLIFSIVFLYKYRNQYMYDNLFSNKEALDIL